MIVGYSFGAWDLLHVGHLNQLEQAKLICDFLIVGVFTDEVVAGFKREPIIPFEQRMRLVAGLKCVNMVVAQYSRDPTDVLKEMKPDILFHGNDWSEIPGAEYMESTGGRVASPAYFEGVSTSEIIKKIQERCCEEDRCDCSCGVEGRG